MTNPLEYKDKKPKISLLCPHFIEGLAGVLTHYQSGKYKGVDFRKEHRPKDMYLDALSRHLLEIYKGNEYDPEDNNPHILKVAINAMMYYNNHHIK